MWLSYNIKKLHDEGNIKQFHINDIDTYRIDFYNNMKDKKKRDELFEIETIIKEKGKDEYIKYVNKDRKDYSAYTISKRIYGFRYGIYPTNKIS